MGKLRRRGELWSRRESNPRPSMFPESFLHAYSGIGVQETTGAGQTDGFPELLVLSNSRSTLLPQPVWIG